jgi:hypothetical protein
MDDPYVVNSRNIFVDVKDVIESWIGGDNTTKDMVIFQIDRIVRFDIQIEGDFIREKGEGEGVGVYAIKRVTMNGLFKVGRRTGVKTDTEGEESDRETSVHFFTDTGRNYCCCRNSTTAS